MKFGSFIMKATSLFALALAIVNVNSACMCIMHQPKVPDAARRYQR